jgi:protoporphyrinogen oxidase
MVVLSSSPDEASTLSIAWQDQAMLRDGRRGRMKPRLVVLGAGLTGLAAARHLLDSGFEVTVLEKEDQPGGACRTVERDGFFFDFTGHLLHLHDAGSRLLLARLGLEGQLREHTRRAAVCLSGVVTPYPIQIHTHRLPAEVRRDCVLGFVEALLGGGEPAVSEASFADWVVSRFGQGLARHFFFPYNRKLFLADPEDFTAEWTGKYVPRPGLAEVIDGAFGLHRGAVGYNASFLYPRRGGIDLLARALSRGLPDLRLGCEARALSLAERELELDNGQVVGFDALLATISLRRLAELTVDLPAPARAAARGLRAVDVVNVNLGVRGPAPRREHWLYVPEPRYPFYRVGLPSNHGRLAPGGCHTVSVEVSVPAGSAPPPELHEQCLAGLETLGLLRDRADVLTCQTLRLSPAYVVFDPKRREALQTLTAAFAGADVRLAGRWAEWGYAAMEDALLAGQAAARSVTG